MGGVIYAHSTEIIRIWVRLTDSKSSVVSVADGWGFTLKATEGTVRILGWKSLGQPLFSGQMDVDMDGDLSLLPPGLVLGSNSLGVDSVTSLASLQVCVDIRVTSFHGIL